MTKSSEIGQPHPERQPTDNPTTPTTPEIGTIEARTVGLVPKGEETLSNPQRSFLACFREMGVVSRACEAADVGRSTHYGWMDRTPAYKLAVEAAHEDAIDSMVAEGWRRAVKGVRKPVGWYKGVAGGKVREYSDNLLMFLLKGARPETYRERVEVSGTLRNLDVRLLPHDLIARLADGESPLTVLAPLLQAKALPVLKGERDGSTG